MIKTLLRITLFLSITIMSSALWAVQEHKRWDNRVVSSQNFQDRLMNQEFYLINSFSSNTKDFPFVVFMYFDSNCNVDFFNFMYSNKGDIEYKADNRGSYHNVLIKTSGRNFRYSAYPNSEFTPNEKAQPSGNHGISFVSDGPRVRGFLNAIENSKEITLEFNMDANRHTFSKTVSAGLFLEEFKRHLQECRQ